MKMMMLLSFSLVCMGTLAAGSAFAAPGDKGAPAAKRLCMKDKGCPAPVKLAKCAADLKFERFEGVSLRTPPKSGSQVSYKGVLKGDAACTERACDMACCNSCHGDMVLAIQSGLFDSPRKDVYETLRLKDDKDPKRFRVYGDETAICHPVDGVGKEVVVRGVFTLEEGQYSLRNPTICLP